MDKELATREGSCGESRPRRATFYTAVAVHLFEPVSIVLIRPWLPFIAPTTYHVHMNAEIQVRRTPTTQT